MCIKTQVGVSTVRTDSMVWSPKAWSSKIKLGCLDCSLARGVRPKRSKRLRIAIGDAFGGNNERIASPYPWMESQRFHAEDSSLTSAAAAALIVSVVI